MGKRSLGVVASVVLLVASAASAQQPVVIDLGTLGGTNSYARAVNAHGQVVGASDSADGNSHAFSWTAEQGMLDLGTLGGRTSSGYAVNDSGGVAGVSDTVIGTTHAFIWSADRGMVDLGTLGGSNSYASAINNDGLVVGFSDTASGSQRAFVWTENDGLIALPTLGGTRNSATDVNNADLVVGSSMLPGDAAQHAFAWTRTGGMVDLGTLESPPCGFSAGRRVSDANQVVGSSVCGDESHAFSWTSTRGIVDVGTLGGNYSVAGAPTVFPPRVVNDRGAVVGSSTLPGNAVIHAFLWTEEGGIQDLGTLGGGNSLAYGVNNDGDVIGISSWPGDVIYNAFLWTPEAGMVDLGTLGGAGGSAIDVNDAGLIVGSSGTADGASHATAWLLPVNVATRIDHLLDQLRSEGSHRGPMHALSVKLEAALASWQRGDSTAALGQLGAFVHQVRAQRGKALTTAQADTLTDRVNVIIDAIASGTAI